MSNPKAIDMSKVPFVPLGFRSGIHYFYMKKNGNEIKDSDIIEVKSFSLDSLLMLHDLTFWQSWFVLTEAQKNNVLGFNKTNAADFLVKLSKKIGLYSPHRLRGLGTWKDAGHIVVNCGDFLITSDGLRKELETFKSEFTYIKPESGGLNLPETILPLSDSEIKLIIDAAKSFKWKRDCDAEFLLGWLMLAPIMGILPIRPHMWLTGKKGLGKSTLLERLVKLLLGRVVIVGVGLTTEAGIRQTFHISAQPLLHDEFEATDKDSIKRVGKAIDHLRSCWSDSVGITMKGTPTGRPLNYTARTAAFLSSIKETLITGADRSRFTIIELRAHAKDAKERRRDRKAINENLKALAAADYHPRLFSQSITRIKQILENYEVFSDVITEELTSRDGQQLGMILAGRWALDHEQVITEAEARIFFAEILKSLGGNKDHAQVISDEEECLNLILTRRITYSPDGQPKNIVEDIIGNMIFLRDAYGVLLNYGIRVNHIDKTFAVANQHSALKHFFISTRWEAGGWGKTLQDLDGAKSLNPLKFDVGKSRSVAIPFKFAQEFRKADVSGVPFDDGKPTGKNHGHLHSVATHPGSIDA